MQPFDWSNIPKNPKYPKPLDILADWAVKSKMWPDTMPGIRDPRDPSAHTIRKATIGERPWLSSSLAKKYSIYQFGFSGLTGKSGPLALISTYHLEGNGPLAPLQKTTPSESAGLIWVNVVWSGPDFRGMSKEELTEFLWSNVYDLNLSKVTAIESQWVTIVKDPKAGKQHRYEYTFYPMTNEISHEVETTDLR
jgi:hypothetical protein